MLDIPETEIMDCLQVIVRQNKPTASALDTDAMQIDSAPSMSDLPALPAFLALCVTYVTSPAALRAAIRRSLKDADDVLAVVKVLEQWVNRWSMRDANLLPSKREGSENGHGVQVLEKRKEDFPPLKNAGLLIKCIHHD